MPLVHALSDVLSPANGAADKLSSPDRDLLNGLPLMPEQV